jgi:SNF2 family DNA or RNA helicase
VVAHYASGGEALNLQFMHYWCSISPNYSYSTSLQARGRIKRIGQTKPMFFYYLKAVGTIEDDIYACLKGKSDFSEKNWCKQLEEELTDKK